MKSCKIFTSALLVSLIATSAGAMCRRCSGGSCGRRSAQPARNAQTTSAARVQPAPQTIGNGQRVLSIHNSSPELPIFYKVVVDLQNPPANWSKTSNAMPIVIRYNDSLTLQLATDDQGSNRKIVMFTAADLQGKTILLSVSQHYYNNSGVTGLEVLIQPDALATVTMQTIYRGMGINSTIATNITPAEITAQITATRARLVRAARLAVTTEASVAVPQAILIPEGPIAQPQQAVIAEVPAGQDGTLFSAARRPLPAVGIPVPQDECPSQTTPGQLGDGLNANWPV